jgi:hypothetical protein
MIVAGSTAAFMIRETGRSTRPAPIKGKYEQIIRCMRPWGTILIWSSEKSTFKEPLKRSDALNEETTWPIMLFKVESSTTHVIQCFDMDKKTSVQTAKHHVRFPSNIAVLQR